MGIALVEVGSIVVTVTDGDNKTEDSTLLCSSGQSSPLRMYGSFHSPKLNCVRTLA